MNDQPAALDLSEEARNHLTGEAIHNTAMLEPDDYTHKGCHLTVTVAVPLDRDGIEQLIDAYNDLKPEDDEPVDILDFVNHEDYTSDVDDELYFDANDFAMWMLRHSGTVPAFDEAVVESDYED